MFFGIRDEFLDALENLYNKPYPDDQFGALHTYAVHLKKQGHRSGFFSGSGASYSLIWKPFIGFRWFMTVSIPSGTLVVIDHAHYTRLENKWDHSRTKIVNLDLQCSVLEVEQKYFKKWRGDELTNKLIEHLSHPERTKLFQQHMRDVFENVKAGKCFPRGKPEFSRPTLSGRK